MTNRMLALPKVDLHLHLDGSVLPATIIDLAREAGERLPAEEPGQLLPYMRVEGECKSLIEYLNKFRFVGQFLHTPYSLERAAYEVVEQASAQNCLYIEVRFAPQLHRKLGLTVEDAIHYVVRGLQQGERDFGVMARCIAICLRGHSEEFNREVIRAASLYLGKGVVAVDLAGAEAAFPAELYRDIFAMARERGLPITIHAGEAAGAASVRTAVELLGANRVGHGVRMREDSAVVELIRRGRIPLELCPISNLQTKAVDCLSSYPIRDYFDKGILVTVNTDNLTVSDTTITKEYELLHAKLGFSEEEVGRIAMYGAEAAFVKGAEKKELLARFGQQLALWQ
ncbi:adenosine deaminase [Paenibacillus sp. 1011MAR3C5]|uniref:adenosine deaminase n=1 Tax=Paenibacillus sp. 1011MAR3C5 TaxID=1675787 RepID=UPI000E6C7CB8|nr:adenosine deaminase [Paenibacillus sp. 1011MAR3C5]RJE86855.1 adenosine deaminase [Paenibacillus sp. 1011MAR3C5]